MQPCWRRIGGEEVLLSSEGEVNSDLQLIFSSSSIPDCCRSHSPTTTTTTTTSTDL